MSVCEKDKIAESCELYFIVWQEKDQNCLLFHISNIPSLKIFKTKKECGKNAVLWILGLSNGSSTDRKWWLVSQTNILCPWLSYFVLQHSCVLLPQLQWVPSCLFGATRSFPDVTTVESAGDGSAFKTVRWGPWQKPKSQCGGLPIVPGLVPWVWQEWQLCPSHPGAVDLQEVTWQMPGSSPALSSCNLSYFDKEPCQEWQGKNGQM